MVLQDGEGGEGLAAVARDEVVAGQVVAAAASGRRQSGRTRRQRRRRHVEGGRERARFAEQMS